MTIIDFFKNVDKQILQEAVDMATQDIKYNKIKFKKMTNFCEVIKLISICIEVLEKCSKKESCNVNFCS